MKNFLKDGRLQVPSTEIDNIYIWTRITRTQEVLLSAKQYYAWAEKSFKADSERITSILKAKIPSIDTSSYQFSDFITFIANKNKIFNDNTCFVYSTSSKLLDSLVCFIAHTQNKFVPEIESLPGLIINKIDEPDKFTNIMDKDFVILNVYAPLPDHKWRSAILETLLSRRSKSGLCTLLYLLNKSLLIGKDFIEEERAKRHKLIDLNPLVDILLHRRTQTYQEIMPKWLELLEVDLDDFVYSKKEPTQHFRKINRYQK